MTKASDNAFPSILITEGTEPSAPAAGKQRLYIDSTTHKLKRTDSSGTDVTIEATGGGGGLAQSYVGYNTVGGTWTTMTGGRQLCKKVTLAATSTFLSIGAYLRASTDNFGDVKVAILTDSAGVPDLLTAVGGGEAILLSNASSGLPHTGRWVSVPINATLAAGDYWICFAAAAGYYDIANDGSGSDVYWALTGAYMSGSHSGLSKTTGTVKYSIRASVLS